MESIAQQEAEDLARSLPFDQSQLWGGAVLMVGAIALVLDKESLKVFLINATKAKFSYCPSSILFLNPLL